MHREPLTAPPAMPVDLDPPLPLIPEPILRRFECFEPVDSRFQRAARLLQSLWRIDQDLHIGRHRRPDGTARELGSRISLTAGRAGGNFLLPEIAQLVRREVIYREIGAVVDTERLYCNLLSSMPLAFNLFAPLKRDNTFATQVLTLVLPGFAGEVTEVLFEHAPGRGSPLYTADFTAFDVLIRYRGGDGARGFIAIEQKYSETMTEMPGLTRPHLDELSRQSGLYKDPDAPALRASPIQQLWREHLLADAMLRSNLYDEGCVIVVAPRLNWHVQGAAGQYARLLKPRPDGAPVFSCIYLERFIEAIATAGQPDFANAMHRRYCDFARIDALIDAYLEAEDQLDPRRTADPTSGERSAAPAA